MKHHHFIILVALLCLLIAPAAADVSDSSVTNTNIYAGSYVYDIAPDGYVDAASTATGISNVAGRYIYASSLTNTVNESTATLVLLDRQGATVNLTDSAVVSGILVDWGDGSTSDSLTHEYSTNGIYNVTATVTNYLDQTGITLTDRVQIGETSISISVSPAVLTTGQSWTLTADAVIADTVQWQVSRNNATWTDIPEGTYTPAEYGEYYFRAIAYGADISVISNVVQTEYRYAVTDSTVVNTNVYAGSNVYSIAPDGYYDSASSATGITNVNGRYIYASALGNTVNESTATLILMDRQGATVNLTDSAVVSGILVDWGDGSTSDSLTHEYAADGIYNVTATVTNYLDQTGITLTDRVQIGETSISISVSPAVLTTGQSWTLTADAVIADTVQWQVSRNNATWTDIPAGTYTPTEYGEYYLRAIAYGADISVISNVVQTEYRYAVTDSTVTNTNVYAGSNVYSIAPDGYYDSASTATGISNVAGRYIYADSITASLSGATTAYSISGRQGSTTLTADIGTVQGIVFDYGDNMTGSSWKHTYAAPGKYTTTLQLTNALDQTGITLTADEVVVGPIVNNITADKTAGGLRTSFNLSVDAETYTSIQWQYSTNGITWLNLIGSTGPDLTYTPAKTGYWYVRAAVYNADTGFLVHSDTVTIVIWPAPVINQVSVDPKNGGLNPTVTLTGTVTDNAGGTTFQWQSSADGTTWTDISGATTATWIGTLNLPQAGKYFYRLLATGIGGTATSNIVAYTAYAAPQIQNVQSSADIVSLPGSVVLSAYATDTNTYTWQELRSGSWVNIGSGSRINQQITSAGVHSYRVQVSGYGGSATSQTITVDAGYPPTVEIISPQTGETVQQNATITVTANVQNADTYSWDFGSAEHYETISGTTAEVRYPQSSSNVISLTASNRYGTVKDAITVIVMYDFNRPTADGPVSSLDDSDLTNWMDSLAPEHNSQMPDIMGIFANMLTPYLSLLGSWMYLILYAVPYLIIWIRQKNIIIPSILGVLFGSWLLVQMPAGAMLPAIGILILSISGGIYGIYVKYQR